MKPNPRFYQIRAKASESVLASYVVLIYDEDPNNQQLGCELYCIFSNFDDSNLSGGNDEPSIKQKLRIEGQASTIFKGTRQTEEQKLTDLMYHVYDDQQISVVMRKVRP